MDAAGRPSACRIFLDRAAGPGVCIYHIDAGRFRRRGLIKLRLLEVSLCSGFRAGKIFGINIHVEMIGV